jgi:glycosyltransferase involved in cell wall biosynthesis
MFGREISDSRVEITLAICTYNRRDSLSETLDTVAAQRAAQSWEGLVIDNNSANGTSELVGERAPNFPSPLHVIREGKQGRSFALNRAIEAAHGDVLIFTDDDVNFRPGFVAAHAALYADPEVTGGSGWIVRRILRESLNFLAYPEKAALGPREMSVRLYNLTQRVGMGNTGAASALVGCAAD